MKELMKYFNPGGETGRPDLTGSKKSIKEGTKMKSLIRSLLVCFICASMPLTSFSMEALMNDPNGTGSGGSGTSGSGAPVAPAGPTGNWITMAVYKNGVMVGVNDYSNGTLTNYVNGQPVNVVRQPDGTVINTYTYDSSGKLVSSTAANGDVTSYGSNGLPTQMIHNATDPATGAVSQTVTTYSFDSSQLMTGSVTKDSAGNQVSATTYSYNGVTVSQTKTTDANGTTTTNFTNGLATSSVDPKGVTTTMTYGAYRNLLTAVTSTGQTTYYNKWGDQTATYDKNNVELVSYTYSAKGVIQSSYDFGTKETSAYDAFGNYQGAPKP